MPNAVLVVDMIRGFCEEGYPLFAGVAARRIIPRVRELLEEEIAKGSKVIFICDNHEPDDREFEVFPQHCIKGTEEAEIIPELSDIEGVTVPKQRYSGFFDTDLEQILAELVPEKIVVCGVCTDICVMHTVADARNRDYQVSLPSDCVATFSEEGQRFALDHIENILGAQVLPAKSTC